MIFESMSEHDTYGFGYRLGQEAQAGSVICLDGDLGAGKTVLTKGFAAGLGITEPVTSPTFTIIQEYCGGRLPLYHFDVYRIEDEEELEVIGANEYFYGDGVCLVEWACKIPGSIPADAKKIRIERDYTKNDNYRKLTVE